MSYIQFLDAGESQSGLTKIWHVRSNAGAMLGTISWYAPWRRYCFHPTEATTFDAVCLLEISDFCAGKGKAHNAS
jgi:hypothetical protein